MDLHTETVSALDWEVVLHALASCARTPMGRRQALVLEALPDLSTVLSVLDATDELIRLEEDGGWVPVGDVLDAEEAFTRASKDAVLDKIELRTAGRCLQGMLRLADYLLQHEQDAPVLQRLASEIQIDPSVAETILSSFDDTGDLSARTYPELGMLRQRIHDLHISIRRTLDELVSGDALKDVLQDRYITQRGDRYVLPIKANFKRREMGIVHGMSGSGNTAFVEPHQVVSLNNDLRLAEGQLEAAERRILASLSKILGRIARAAIRGLATATEIDLIAARAGIASKLEATRPVVAESGVVQLREARHPVLALRDEVDVVPNDLELDEQRAALVISGPNTGGKTIALKTVGLCAMMARIGCFLPASEGSRIDLFHTVTALIGDHQTVHGDHSSFSSHLVALQSMLTAASPGCLFLVDEIASGTDPQQGAALAHAILEAFLERGPRAIITTHFHRLKTVSAMDDRFTIAGMQFANGRPTYRLIPGASGDSHALETASRIGLPPEVVERARALMGEGERELADTLSALDRERERAEAAARRAAELAAELEAQKTSLAAKEARLTAKAEALKEEKAAAFLQRLNQAEKAISAVVADLQNNPSHRGVQTARAAANAVRGLVKAPKPPINPTPKPVAAESLKVGDRVRLTKLGKIGEITSLSGRQAKVRAGGLQLAVKLTELERLDEHGRSEPVVKTLPPRTKKDSGETKRPHVHDAVRHPANTVDLRGMRVDEGIEAVEKFFDQATMRNHQIVFILHGHGTGRMKTAIRRWLPSCGYVEDWAPAMPDQGGDAYTVAAMR